MRSEMNYHFYQSSFTKLTFINQLSSDWFYDTHTIIYVANCFLLPCRARDVLPAQNYDYPPRLPSLLVSLALAHHVFHLSSRVTRHSIISVAVCVKENDSFSHIILNFWEKKASKTYFLPNDNIGVCVQLSGDKQGVAASALEVATTAVPVETASVGAEAVLLL